MPDGAIVDLGNCYGTAMKCILILGALALLSACGRGQPAPVAANAPPLTEPADPAFVGKIWISTTPGHAIGTMLIFMPDRTLVMDSCHETYRLVKWGVAGEHIRWLEDTIPIQAAVKMPRPTQLILRIPGIDQDQSYMAASAPYRCPEMPK